MTAPVTDVLATDLPSLDAAVACEYGTECPCAEPAVWRARMHGFRRPGDAVCGNYILLLCDEHLTSWRDGIARILATAPQGAMCGGCGKGFNHVSDVLMEVTAL